MPFEGPTRMDQPSRIHGRAYYRLRYPRAERPTVRIEDRDYEVSEVSERGARIVLTGACAVPRDQPFAGVLRFRDGETGSIEGVVLRSDEKEMVVGLSSGVSLKRMMAEQIRLRQKYPMFFDTIEGANDTETE